MRLELKKLDNELKKFERNEVEILKEQIKMCRSMQNYSNWYLIEDQIASIILMIMEIEGVEFEREGNKNMDRSCESCERPCENEWCVTKK
jgi:hypothetical protein